MSYRYYINDHFEGDGDGRRHVKEFVVTKGEPPEDFPKYVGVGIIEIQIGPQIAPRQFSANLNAETLDEAFENFDKIMTEASEMAKKEFEQEIKRMQSQPRILVPG